MCPNDSPRSVVNLIATEATEILPNPHHWQPHPLDRSYIYDDSNLRIEHLIRKDPGFESIVAISDLGETDPATSWIRPARLISINWVLSSRVIFQFQLQTAYASLVYFDRFLARITFERPEHRDDFVHLLSVACLSLAAKMDEVQVPLLHQYSPSESIPNRVTQKAELVVSSILEGKLLLVAPFVYLRYFVNKFYEEKDSCEVVPSAVDVIMSAIRVINLRSGGASIIAAAAVLVAVDPYLLWHGIESKAMSIPSWGSEQSRQVFACYNLMKELDREWIGRPNIVFSPV